MLWKICGKSLSGQISRPYNFLFSCNVSPLTKITSQDNESLNLFELAVPVRGQVQFLPPGIPVSIPGSNAVYQP